MTKLRAGKVFDSLLIGLAAFFCLGTAISRIPRTSPAVPRVREAFDPKLQSVTTVDSAVAYVLGEDAGGGPRAIADAIDKFGRLRFYHGYSYFDPGQDWLAYLAGFARNDLRSPVLADDILKHPDAACSQQTIVFEAIARRLGLDVGTIQMDGRHMVPAVRIGGQWQVYDTDREIPAKSYPLAKLLAGDPAIAALYGPFGRSIDISGQATRGDIRLININRDLAPRGGLFHRLTHALSKYGWAFFLILFLFRLAPRIILRLTAFQRAGSASTAMSTLAH